MTAMPDTPQPGQEQRMVTDAMIEAGREAYSDWQQSLDPRTCSLSEAIYLAMHATRPTADLGEDGGLVERLRARNDPPPSDPLCEEAADRLILYREALEAIIDRAPERDLKWAGMTARDIAIAVLSRSGG